MKFVEKETDAWSNPHKNIFKQINLKPNFIVKARSKTFQLVIVTI